MKNKLLIFLLFAISLTVVANLPPTTSRGTGESDFAVTFNTDYDTIPVTRNGGSITIGTIPISKGGTGETSQVGAFDNLSPLTTLGDTIYHDGTDNVRLPGNVSNQQKVLVQTGDGVNSAAPSWQTLPTPGILTYMLADQVADVVGYDYMPAITNFTAAAIKIVTQSVTTTPTILYEFVTPVGYPNITVIPIGFFSAHIEVEKAAGANNYFVFFEVYKRDTGGTETLLATSENSSNYSVNTVQNIDLTAAILSQVNLLSSDRLVLKVYAQMVSSSAAIAIRYDDNTDARLSLPSATVDATNFVPYSGSTANVDLGAWGITANSVTIPSLTSGSVLFSSGSVVEQDNANLFFDNANNRLGIGTSSPASTLSIASGQVSAPVGSAATPSYSFAGDLDNGMFLNTTNQLALSTAGTTRLFLGTTATFAVPVESGAGSVSSPAFRISTDSNTGIFSSGADFLSIATGGVERLSIGSTGSVGINKTSSFLGQLDIVTLGAFADTVPSIAAGKAVTSGNSIGASFRNFTGSTGNSSIEISGINTGAARVTNLLTNSTGDFSIHTGSTTHGTLGTERLTIQQNGNVGINGAPNTNAILDVQSTTKAFMPPRQTTTQKNAVATPTAGMVVYDSDQKGLSTYNGTAWTTTGPLSVSSKTTTYAILFSDDVILCDATSTGFTVTLPTAVGNSGKVFYIKKTDASANTVTIATTSSQTIDGSTTNLIQVQYRTIQVVSDGSNWSVL